MKLLYNNIIIKTIEVILLGAVLLNTEGLKTEILDKEDLK